VVHAAGIPVVLHLHGGDFERWLGTLSPVRTRFARRILGRAARVLILAAGWRPLLERFAPPEHIAVLPNAIDCAQFAPPARTHAIERPRVLFLGLLSERKGLDELCAALQRLRDDGRLDFDVDIVGGEEVLGSRRRYEEHFAAAGLASWVRFHGPAFGADKLRFLHAAEVFVLPSRAESFGIANLEAMAAGLAVISSRTGAIPEYLEDGVHGLLIAPGDAAALAVAIDRLMNDPALRRRLGAAARLRARDYDWNVMTGRLGELYAGILQPLSVATDHRPKP
jgi:glycosyltransferase involved in cell wall biosynthesis